MRTVVVVMGVGGSGKSTIGALLADRLGWPLREGEDFRPLESATRALAGLPETDVEWRAWLETLRDWVDELGSDVVLTCTAVRRRDRDVLRQADARLLFVHLLGSRDLIEERVGAGSPHFHTGRQVDSALAEFEPLQPDERGVTVPMEPYPTQTADAVLAGLGFDF